jgi:AbrB family looped-hinge helix DNA binding protein
VKVIRNGQITLPKALRDRLGLSVGDYLQANIADGKIVMRPVNRKRSGNPIFRVDLLCAMIASHFTKEAIDEEEQVSRH